MKLRTQFRWGGGILILGAAMWTSGEILIRSGAGGFAAHSLYSLGAITMVPAVAFLYLVQGAGPPGAPGFILATSGMLLTNVAVFLGLAESAGIAGMDAALVGIWGWLRYAFPVRELGFLLMGMAVFRGGFLPRTAGLLVVLGILVRLPQPDPLAPISPVYTITGIAGTLLLGAGLTWAGTALRRFDEPDSGGLFTNSEHRPPAGNQTQGSTFPLISRVRPWQGVFVILAAFIYILNAQANNIGELSLFDGLVNLLDMLTLPIAVTLLYARQAHRSGAAGWTGFLLVQLGAALMAVPACFIAAQLAGQLADNRALMASWADIPIATTGQILLILGLFVFGAAVVPAGVYPRWAGWLVAAGIAMSIPAFVQAQAYFFLVFWAVGATLTGIGLARMGWDLLRLPAAA